MPQGLMFLPDGKALIMDQQLYRQTIEKSIVIDLVENGLAADPHGLGANSGARPEEARASDWGSLTGPEEVTCGKGRGGERSVGVGEN